MSPTRTKTKRSSTPSSPRSTKPERFPWRKFCTQTVPRTWRGGARPTQGWRVIRWIEKHCVHTDGEWIGKPFRLLLWQKLVILALFAADPDTGQRLYRWALIGVPKKNGKTELAAALGLYFLIGDGEPSPLVVCAAASDDQADLVFGAAKRMCELSPTLQLVTEVWEREITVPSSPGARLIRVSAAVGTNDGKNIHAVICDELHEWVGTKGEGVWNVLTNGLGARRQPMILQITTAGHDVDGTICGQQYTYCQRVAAGEVDDPRYFFFWVEAPAHADHTEPATWEAANPSYNQIIFPEFFADQLGKKREAVFRRYFLNSWTLTEDIWAVAAVWPELRKKARLRADLPLYVGIDVGIRHDSCAVASVQRQPRRFVVRAQIWENPYPRQDPRHDQWVLNIFEVRAYLRGLYEQFPEWARPDDGPGPAFGYDPAYFTESAQELEGDGLNMIEFPQSDARMVPASQRLYQLAMERRIADASGPALLRHIRNVQADERRRGWRMSKPKGSRRYIDGAIATGIGIQLYFESVREDSEVNISLV